MESSAFTSEASLSKDKPTSEVLFCAHFADVYRVVGRLLGPSANDADIEDMTQEVFAAAHRGLAGYRGEGKPMTWLYGIATRVVLAHLRSSRRRKRLLDALAVFGTGKSVDGERQFEDRSHLRVVWRALDSLGEKKRTVYILHELEGVSGTDIADALGIPQATVWTRLYHARRELAQQIKTLKRGRHDGL